MVELVFIIFILYIIFYLFIIFIIFFRVLRDYYLLFLLIILLVFLVNRCLLCFCRNVGIRCLIFIRFILLVNVLLLLDSSFEMSKIIFIELYQEMIVFCRILLFLLSCLSIISWCLHQFSSKEASMLRKKVNKCFALSNFW